LGRGTAEEEAEGVSEGTGAIVEGVTVEEEPEKD
jgi:hypothetical protein